MRLAGDQVLPSWDVLKTMSFEEQLVRNLQSCQTTKDRPAASIAADGKLRSRRPPAMEWVEGKAMVTAELQVLPPSLEPYAMSEVRNASLLGTITVPLGFAIGIPPNPVGPPAGCFDGPQVNPPSVDVFKKMTSPARLSSHSAYQCPKNGLVALLSQA